MDDARPVRFVPARDRVPEQAVDQRAAGVTCRWMDDHARRLVDHQQMLVLPGDPERSRLRLETRRRGGKLVRHPLTRLEAVTLRPAAAVDDDLPLGEQALRRRARTDAVEGGDEAVESLAGSLGRY